MDYEPYKVSYTAGQPYVGATVSMYPAPDSHGGMGNFIAWDATKGEIVWSKPEQFSVWSGALATEGDVVFYGTLEGYIKAVDHDGKELYKFKTPSGIIGNINTFEHGGKQYIAVLSGVGGWAAIGLAGGLLNPENAAAWHDAVDQGRARDEAAVVGTAGLGAVGGYAGLADYTTLGGQLTVFGLPD
jgi:glucose dehydrogenase